MVDVVMGECIGCVPTFLGLSSRDNVVIYHTGMGRLKSSVGVVICVKLKMPLKSP